MAGVQIPVAKQVITKSCIDNIVLSKGLQFFFPLYIISLDIIEKVGFFQRPNISRYCLCSRFSLPGSVFQKLFTDEWTVLCFWFFSYQNTLKGRRSSSVMHRPVLATSFPYEKGCRPSKWIGNL